jgi:hypothetical protein
MEVEAHGGGGIGARTGRSCNLPGVVSSDIGELNIDEKIMLRAVYISIDEARLRWASGEPNRYEGCDNKQLVDERVASTHR